MGIEVLIDTSFLIAALEAADSHHESAKTELRKLPAGTRMNISAITQAEALVAPMRMSDAHFHLTSKLITGRFTILEVNSEIAQRAAQIRSKNKITLVDAIIIATALHYKQKLYTFDRLMKAVYDKTK